MRAPLAAAVLFALTAPSAFAAEGDDVLKTVDTNMNAFEDQRISWEVRNLRPGTSTPTTMKFNTAVKGGKTYSEFTAPGDIKGTRTLTTGPTQIWVWLPEFGKIRRVASHALEQGFMGTTLNQQDMGTLSYAALYTPTLSSQTDAEWVLQLDTKDDKATAYDRLRMTVSKEFGQPTKIEYLDAEGKVVRTQERTGYSCPMETYCTFKTLKMTDHSRGDAWTELISLERKMNTGLTDDVFTPRTLQLGL